jgi:multidrug efflux pump subunit AcrA (membrane-fusion protein)
VSATLAALLGAAAYGVSRLRPALPSVERSAIWTDTVKRGPMIRQVRGIGTLVPREDRLRLIPAETDGTVVRIDILPGAKVEPDSLVACRREFVTTCERQSRPFWREAGQENQAMAS